MLFGQKLKPINQQGAFTIFAALAVLVLGLSAFLIYNSIHRDSQKSASESPSSQPSSASQGNSNTAKQQMYDQNKEKIKADLDLSEEEFQVLKRFSAD